MKNSCSFFVKDDADSDAAAYIPMFLIALKHMYAFKAQASVYQHKSNIYKLLFTMTDDDVSSIYLIYCTTLVCIRPHDKVLQTNMTVCSTVLM